MFRSPIVDTPTSDGDPRGDDPRPVPWSGKGPKTALVMCVTTAPAMLLEAVASARASCPGILLVIVMQGRELEHDFMEMVPAGPLTRWLILPENVGEPKGLNIGLRAAIHYGAEMLISANFDIVFHEDAIPRMLDGWKRAKRPGLLGPLTNLCWTNCGQVQHNASFRLPEDVQVDTPAGRKTVRRLSWVPYVNGFCVMTSRRVLEEVGFYDEGFPPYAGLDDDLCFRAKLAGYRLYIDRAAFVYHKGGGSRGAVAQDRGLAKQKAAERLMNKYGVQHRQMLYHALEIGEGDRRAILRIMDATLPVLADVSDIRAYTCDPAHYQPPTPGTGVKG